MHKPKPHVSAALKHLRFSIAALGFALGFCLLLQLLVWAFVHYTDARWTTLAPGENKVQSTVVVRHPKSGEEASAAPAPPKAGAAAPEVAPAADANTVLSRNDRWFYLISQFAQTFGVVAAVTLAAMMALAVVVAAGGATPGVERAVTSCTWTTAIALFCLPLADVLPSLPYPGVFSSYETITAASDAIRRNDPAAPSAALFFCQHLILPLSMLIGLAIVVLRFQSGVEQGVIATSVSELDEKLEKEISSIKLAATAAPRTIGALNRAIGEVQDMSQDVSASIRRGGRAARAAETPRLPTLERSITEPSPGDPLQRPI